MSLALRSPSAIAWSGPAPAGIVLHDVYFGPDPKGLGGFEVAVAVVDHAPTVGELKHLHNCLLYTSPSPRDS